MSDLIVFMIRILSSSMIKINDFSFEVSSNLLESFDENRIYLLEIKINISLKNAYEIFTVSRRE